MSELATQIQESVAAIRAKRDFRPQIGIILGTGISGLAKDIEADVAISYDEIPNFPIPIVHGEDSKVVLGRLSGKNVIALEGRCHYYEGFTMQQITHPVRVMRALGAEVLVVTSASGGMNPQHKPGDLIIIEDHINLMGDNPLIGPNDDSLGPRFPDMCEPYDKKLVELAGRIALEEKVKAHTGVYVAVAGPNLETRAEYRFLRGIGADVVGMSTVPEVIVAVHCGLRALGISIITDSCLPDALKPADIEEIIAVANAAEPNLTRIIKRVVEEL